MPERRETHVQAPPSLARQVNQQVLHDTENAIVRSETIITLQREVIAATERAGHDATRDQALLTVMEHDLAKLGDWRQSLLEELSAA